jgi:hypothetical protein
MDAEIGRVDFLVGLQVVARIDEQMAALRAQQGIAG